MIVLIQFVVCRTQGSVLGFPGGAGAKNLPASARDAGDMSSIPGSGRSPGGGGNGTPLQYSCLGNPMDRGAWPAIVQGVTKSQTHLSTRVHRDTQNQSVYMQEV